MSNSPSKTAPQRPKTAAQRASDANRIMQHAVRTNTSRPNDRNADDKQLQADHHTAAPAAKPRGAT
ncbi:MAG TPA: hypothetical protein VMT98_17515 [Verrucomicrobiae bacterium]|nr:hypothetical protein [Verrucomicrobiae bacterium]